MRDSRSNNGDPPNPTPKEIKLTVDHKSTAARTHQLKKVLGVAFGIALVVGNVMLR